eukprot:COSAG01_NODE_3560_length_5928_cov_6.668209_10_plen_157_part_00
MPPRHLGLSYLSAVTAAATLVVAALWLVPLPRLPHTSSMVGQTGDSPVAGAVAERVWGGGGASSFATEVGRLAQPLVFRGAAPRGWRARAWTPSSLAAAAPELQVQVQWSANRWFMFFDDPSDSDGARELLMVRSHRPPPARAPCPPTQSLRLAFI